MSSRRPAPEAGGESSDPSEPALVAPRERRSWRREDFHTAPAEALDQPAVRFVDVTQIDGDPHNIRDTLPNVERLAWSIYQHGLLENLVVIEHPHPERGKAFELRAGSRRFEALRRLREGVVAPPGSADREAGKLWQWPLERQVPVLILGSDGHNEHLVENIERSAPEPWEIGRRLNEALCSGLSSRELGTRIGRSNGWVTRYAQIGRGLAPELILMLRKERIEVKLGELAYLAGLTDVYGDPDGQKQIEAFRARRARRRKRPKRIDPSTYLATRKRLQYLRAEMPVPQFLRPVVQALINYVEGGDLPRFKQLQISLLEQLRSHVEDLDSAGPEAGAT